MAKILIIDDDSSLLDILSLAFEDAEHEVKTAPDGSVGDQLIKSWDPEVVVTDINMPGIDGFTLCKRVREAGNMVPLIMLTSRDNDIDEALGLELGADDYVAKPFSTRVLLARAEALLRRESLRASNQAGKDLLSRGELVLDPERLEIRYGGTLLESTTLTEFRMVEALATRPGIVLTRDQLLQRTRDDDSIVAPRIIDTYVRRLRRKLEAIDPSFDSIETVIGAGYRWRDTASG